jgi:hypothetical protein
MPSVSGAFSYVIHNVTQNIIRLAFYAQLIGIRFAVEGAGNSLRMTCDEKTSDHSFTDPWPDRC